MSEWTRVAYGDAGKKDEQKDEKKKGEGPARVIPRHFQATSHLAALASSVTTSILLVQPQAGNMKRLRVIQLKESGYHNGKD